MKGMIVSNPKLEFLRPALERWFDCIDRYNAVRGDNESPYWFDEKANLGLLSAAAWMAEMVTLEHTPSKNRSRTATAAVAPTCTSPRRRNASISRPPSAGPGSTACT